MVVAASLFQYSGVMVVVELDKDSRKVAKGTNLKADDLTKTRKLGRGFKILNLQRQSTIQLFSLLTSMISVSG
jgi:hypothetical protein